MDFLPQGSPAGGGLCPESRSTEAGDEMTKASDNSFSPRRRSWLRFIPIGVLLLGLAAFFAFHLQDYLSCEMLRDNRRGLRAFIAENQATAAVIFMGLYALAIAFSLPVGALLTFAGGFLFGLWHGTAYVVAAATIGATGLFLAARSALGEGLRGRAGPAVARMEQGFRKNAMSYLLFLRLLPLFPFWLVNLVAAVVGIPVRTFVIATVIGILPASFIFVSVGHGLNRVFRSGDSCDLGAMVEPQIVVPLIGLAVMALVPLVYKALRRHG